MNKRMKISPWLVALVWPIGWAVSQYQAKHQDVPTFPIDGVTVSAKGDTTAYFTQILLEDAALFKVINSSSGDKEAIYKDFIKAHEEDHLFYRVDKTGKAFEESDIYTPDAVSKMGLGALKQ